MCAFALQNVLKPTFSYNLFYNKLLVLYNKHLSNILFLIAAVVRLFLGQEWKSLVFSSHGYVLTARQSSGQHSSTAPV